MLMKTIHAMTINSKILNDIYYYFDNFDSEKGGTLAIKDDCIVGFFPISNLDSNANCYSPSFNELNIAFDMFEKQGWAFFGIIHSHVNGSSKPSKEDFEFFKSFMSVNEQFKTLLFPIVCLKSGKKDIAWYLFTDNELTKVEIKEEL